MPYPRSNSNVQLRTHSSVHTLSSYLGRAQLHIPYNFIIRTTGKLRIMMMNASRETFFLFFDWKSRVNRICKWAVASFHTPHNSIKIWSLQSILFFPKTYRYDRDLGVITEPVSISEQLGIFFKVGQTFL